MHIYNIRTHCHSTMQRLSYQQLQFLQDLLLALTKSPPASINLVNDLLQVWPPRFAKTLQKQCVNYNKEARTGNAVLAKMELISVISAKVRQHLDMKTKEKLVADDSSTESDLDLDVEIAKHCAHKTRKHTARRL